MNKKANRSDSFFYCLILGYDAKIKKRIIQLRITRFFIFIIFEKSTYSRLL